MRSEDVVSPTIRSRASPCQNTYLVGRGRACEGACHAVVIEVKGMNRCRLSGMQHASV